MKKNYNKNHFSREVICSSNIGKRWLDHILLLFMVITSFVGFSQTIQLGSGTSTNSNVPINYNWGFNYTQTIYTAAEMTAAGAQATGGEITKIRFKTNTTASTALWKDWVIYLGNTSKTDFSSNTDWVALTDLIEVFNGEIVATTSAGNWFEITLSTPFQWDGSNIIVAVDENTASFGGSPGFLSYTLAPASGNKAIYYRNDTVNTNPSTPPTASGRTNAVAQIQFFGTLQAGCEGTPNSGTAMLLPMMGNSGSAFSASATDLTSAAGIAYQWQKEVSGLWQDIAGATTINATITSEVASVGTIVNYRLKTTCSISGQSAFSNVVAFTTSIVYCIPSGSANNLDEFLNFTIANLSNTTTSLQGTAGYSDFSETVDPALLQAGLSYEPTLLSGAGSGSHGAAVWIDYNKNGTFEASEKVTSIPASIAANTTVTFPAFTIPVGTVVGEYRLRVQYRYNVAGTLLDPCVVSSFTDTEDYKVSIAAAPTCFQPSALIASNVASKSVTFTWSASSSILANGYDIYYSTANTAPVETTVPSINNQSGTTVNILGLTPLTTYFWWVRSDCDSTDKSLWTAGGSFSTLSDICAGTPAPGNTIASTNVICLGTSVTLSLENETEGLGVTYQWKSSTDGITYTVIADATNASFTVNPVMPTYYLAEVTCTAGPSTGISTAVFISFSNSIATTDPGTRCGVGSVILNATASAEATISWYASQTGGLPLASGNSFTTPIIENTTTYFAGASTSVPGNVAVGTGTLLTSITTQNSVFCNYWGTGWRQMIYTAAEMNAAGLSAGNITSLAFTITTLPDPGTVNNFAVRLGTAASNTVTSTFATTGLNLVFGPLNYTPTIGVNTLTLATPYNWDGVSNILVDIREDGAYDTSNSATYATNTATVSVVHGFASGGTPTPSYYVSNPTGSTTTLRPNIIFNGQLACSSARVAVTATVTTPPALTLSATAVTICDASTSSNVTLTSASTDYDSYIWSPAAGVTGDSAGGWTFSPTVTTTFTLTASQTTGTLCATTAEVTVTVNPIPAEIVFSPAAPQACVNEVLSLSFDGGTLAASGKIGNGSVTNTVSTPYKGYFGGVKTQSIYTAAELTALGMVAGQKISSIGFVALSGTPNVLNGFTISAGFITATTLGTAFNSDASTVVVAPSAYTAPTGAGNLDYALTTPLLWDGISNLLVETCFNNNNSGGISANSISVESSAVPSGLHLYLSGDNNANICTGASGTSSTNRPNLRVTALQTTDIVWTPTTNLFSDAAATIAYVNGDNASMVYFKSGLEGTTTYTVSATTDLTCSISGSVTVTVNALPTLVITDGATLCNGGTTDLTAASVTAGSSAGLTFTYFSDSAATIALANPAAVSAGTYYIKGTSVAGCSTIASIMVTEPTLLVAATTDVTNVSCNGGNTGAATASVTGGTSPYTYLWSNGATTASISGLVAGTYNATITDSNLCTTTVSVTITEGSAVMIMVSNPAAACGETVNITAAAVTAGSDSGLTFTYFTDAAATLPLTNASAITTSGVYYIKGTNASGCSTVASVTVVINNTLAPTGTAIQDFNLGQTLADFTVVGQNIVWYSSATGSTVLPTSTPLVSGVTYFATQTVNGCESTTRLAVTAGVDLKTPTFEISNLRYYPNPVQSVLTVEYSDTIEGVQMYNMLGQLVYNRNTNASKVTIEMTSMAAGNYILQVTVKGITKNVKVIKK